MGPWLNHPSIHPVPRSQPRPQTAPPSKKSKCVGSTTKNYFNRQRHDNARRKPAELLNFMCSGLLSIKRILTLGRLAGYCVDLGDKFAISRIFFHGLWNTNRNDLDLSWLVLLFWLFRRIVDIIHSLDRIHDFLTHHRVYIYGSVTENACIR